MNKKFKFKKSLGQNFLVNEDIINSIVETIIVKKNTLIIEIGSGEGALTKKLKKLNCELYSFEIDKRLEKKLNYLSDNKTYIIYENFLEVDLKRFLEDKKYDNLVFVGNLPYYITTPIIKKITEETKADQLIVMVQKELGLRYMARPSTSLYGSISVYLQYHYDINKVIDVDRSNFYPIPKVDSVVLNMLSKKNKEINGEKFNDLVKDSFKYKRKTLKNNLKNYDLEKINTVLKQKKLSLSNRAENVSVEVFIDIYKEIIKK